MPIRPLCVLLVLVATVSALPAAAPPARFTPEQVTLLRQRNAQYQRILQLWKEGKLDEAEKACRQVLAFDVLLIGEYHLEVARMLHALATIRERQGAGKEGADLLQRRVHILPRLSGAKDHRVVDARWQMADMAARLDWDAQRQAKHARAESLGAEVARLYLQGRFAQGLLLARQAAEQYREVLGEKHPSYATSLNNLALLSKATGEHHQALKLYQQTLKIHREALGEKHPHYASTLNNLAGLLHNLGEHRQALPLYQQALRIRWEILGENHLDVANSLNDLGMLHKDLGAHHQALAFFQHALKLQKEVLGEKHSSYATTLSNLAVLYQEMGAHRQALDLFQHALKLKKEVLGEKHPDLANSLNGLALLYQAMGEHRQALPLVRQALKLRREVLGEKHPSHATSLNNLASLYQAMGEHRQALSLFQQALEIRREALGEKHPLYATSLHNLAGLHSVMGEHRQALALYQQALKIYKEVLGEKHPSHANSLNSLAAIHYAMREHRQALPLLQQALKIRREVLGESHPDYASSLNNLAALYQAMGERGRALPLSGQSLVRSRAHLETIAGVQSERQQLDAEQMLRYRLDHFLSCSPDLEVPASVVHNAVLEAKGSVLYRQGLRRLLFDSSDEATRKLLLELQEVGRDIARLALAGFDPRLMVSRRKRLEDLTRRKDELEAELSQRSELFRQQYGRVTSRQMRDGLPAGVALIDLLVYTRYDPHAREHKGLVQNRLVAFVLRGGQPVVRVELGPVEPIDRTVAAWRAGLTVNRRSTEDPGQVLRRLVWLPIEKHLGDVTTVLLSPDGALASLPFAALPGSKTGTYLLEQYAFAVLPVPRQLPMLLADRKEKTDPSLLLVGNVAFDRTIHPVATADRRSAPVGALKRWQTLPGTAEEVWQIASLFRARYGKKAPTLLEGERATKPALRTALGAHRWVHLATHGFFAPESLKSALDSALDREAGLFQRDGVSGWHPLLLSGIVLAGANREPAPGEEDGILTALEVSELNLQHCELAVLSACETGLGRVAGGQGILGLQRAFAVAGARSTLTSLWSVHDAATSVLMERFYQNLWVSKKVSKLEAIREAQLYVLKNPEVVHQRARVLYTALKKRGLSEQELAARGIERVAGKIAHPSGMERSPIAWWAAFVLAGDWR